LRFRSQGRQGIASRASVVLMLAILLVGGGASYLAFSQGTSGPFTTSTTPDVTTYHPTGSTSTATSSFSIPSSQTSSLTTSSTTSAQSDQTTSQHNASQVEIIIPPGIENVANKVSFEPINVTLKIGVNNTIFFMNNDDQEHILESTSWPSNGQPFQVYSLPGDYNSCVKTGNTPNCLTLTTPGKYTYFCEWHPIWMDGTINVVA
jgi:plastocyanin